MPQSKQDDAEARMRRALGLQRSPSALPNSTPPTSVPSGSPPNRRRFVRDGEVPVTVVHRDHRQDDGHGGSQLEAVRQSLREQTEAGERAERSLTEAQNTIRDLQTKLAHERLSRDEVLQAAGRAEADKVAVQRTLQAARDELVAEQTARQKAEEALEVRQEVEQQQRDMMAAQQPHEPSPALQGKAGVKAAGTRCRAPATVQIDAESHTATPGPARRQTKAAGPKTTVARHGRPADVRAKDTEFVEWWKPGWKNRFRWSGLHRHP
jgi:hypothetical protein